ncbi:MAG: hypothetical protein IT416_04850 [Candidatus Pacebacteria bacterium]|nr:hypothetical protein [Candidatus Paceibacterota bacterium]
MEKTKIRHGVIGVLTHQDQVVFLGLPREDSLSKEAGGKGKQERVKGEQFWTLLSTGMLGFVSGGVKTSADLEQMPIKARNEILLKSLTREALEEFDLGVGLDKAIVKRDGIIEQLRYDEQITFLLWVVSRVVIEENQILKLREKTEVVLVKETKLADFFATEKNRIRPAAQQALITAYNL